MFATDDWFAVAENLLKVSSIILISGAPAVRSAAKRSTCMHRKRKACNSFFMVNMANGMDRGHMRPMTMKNDNVVQHGSYAPADR